MASNTVNSSTESVLSSNSGSLQPSGSVASIAAALQSSFGPIYCESLPGIQGQCIPCSVESKTPRKPKLSKPKADDTRSEASRQSQLDLEYDQLLSEFKSSCKSTGYHTKMKCYDFLHSSAFTTGESTTSDTLGNDGDGDTTANRPDETNSTESLGRISYQSCLPIYKSTYKYALFISGKNFAVSYNIYKDAIIW